jgi:hypothetical protein
MYPNNKPKSQLQELFDAEDEQEENRLKAQGCLIGTLQERQVT